jgi:hypothetical protein
VTSDELSEIVEVANAPDNEDTSEIVQEAAKVDEEAPKPFYARPSVGTWLAPSPLKMAIPEIPQISPAKLECSAMTVIDRWKHVVEAHSFTFDRTRALAVWSVPSFTAPSFSATDSTPRSLDMSDDKLSEIVIVANAPDKEDTSETVLEAAKVDEEAPKPFNVKPSVGTWLTLSPLKIAIAELPQISPAIAPSFALPSFPLGE